MVNTKKMRGGRKIRGGGMEDYWTGASSWLGDMTKRAKHAAGYQEDPSPIIPDYTAPMTESTEPMAEPMAGPMSGPMADPMADPMAGPMGGPMGGRRSRKSRKSRKHATKGKKRKSKRRGKRSRRTRRGRR